MMQVRLTLLVVTALLGGCASMIENPAQRAPVEEIGQPARQPGVEPGPPAPPPQAPADTTVRREPLPPAAPAVLGPPAPPQPLQPATPTASLLAEVDAALAAGEHERAAALCERALRITPRDGELWFKLATIRQQQGRTADARGFAQRALSLAAGNARLERQSRVLLELLELDQE